MTETITLSDSIQKLKKKLELDDDVNKLLLLANKVTHALRSICQLKSELDMNDEPIFTKNKIENIYMGYVYCVTSDVANAVKIGYWRSSIKTLKNRYQTTYGKNLQMCVILTQDARQAEIETHIHFNKYRISGELFVKKHYDAYKQFILKYNNTKDLKTPDIFNKEKKIYICE